MVINITTAKINEVRRTSLGRKIEKKVRFSEAKFVSIGDTN